MKKVIITTSIAALALAFQASAADLVEKLNDETSCKDAAALVTLGMTTNSEIATVTATLETALKAKSVCACEIVKEVIAATGADAESKQALIEAIVETAITALPEQTATITECAVAAAPAHAAAIEKVLERVFGSEDEEYLGEKGYSKQPKQPYYEDEVIEEVSEFPVYALPAPVYLLAPSGGIVPPGLFDRPRVSPADFVFDDDDDDFFDDFDDVVDDVDDTIDDVIDDVFD